MINTTEQLGGAVGIATLGAVLFGAYFNDEAEAEWYVHALGPESVQTVPAGSAHDAALRLPRGDGDVVTVVIPETFRRRSLLDAFDQRLTFRLKLELLRDHDVVVTDVPRRAGEGAFEAKRIVGVVLVRDLTSVSLRAVRYAQSLGLSELHALSVAVDGEDEERIRLDWERHAQSVGLGLDVAQAPYRDLGAPVRDYLRQITADPDVVAAVFLPELVVGGWRKLLHSQRALFVKRLLLFEERVILTSVPHRLEWD